MIPSYWLSVKCYFPFMFMLLGFAFQCIPFLDLLLCSVSVNCFSSLTFLMSQFSVPGSYSYFKSFPDINVTCLWFTSLFLTLLIEQVIASTIHSLSTPTAALGKFLPPLNKFSHFGLFHKYISSNVMYVYIHCLLWLTVIHITCTRRPTRPTIYAIEMDISLIKWQSLNQGQNKLMDHYLQLRGSKEQ